MQCDHCGITAIEVFKVNRKKVCRLCKTDYKLNGKFTRLKVVKDYSAVEERQKKQKELF